MSVLPYGSLFSGKTKDHSTLQVYWPFEKKKPSKSKCFKHGLLCFSVFQGMKRQRSPTPPPSSVASSAYSNYGHSEPKYPHSSESKYVPHARGGGGGGAADVGKYSAHAEAAAKFQGHPDTKYLSSAYQAGGKVGGSGSGSHLYAAQHPPTDFSKFAG